MNTETLLARAVVERHPPKNIRMDDLWLFQHEFRAVIPPTKMNSIQNVGIDGRGLLWEKGSLFPMRDSHLPLKDFWPKVKRALKDVFFGFCSRKVRAYGQPVLHATDDHSNGYFHWLSDVLPRLEIFGNAVLVVPSVHLFPYVATTLEAYPGLTAQIVGVGERVFPPMVTQVTPVAPTGNYRPEIMQAIRRRFLGYFASAVKPAGKKVWISRERATKRKIVNEEDLVPVLQKHGWVRIFMEDLDFQAQVRLMAESVALGGLHGAGLTNMLFMPTGGQVLEIRFRGDSHNNCYFSLASAMEHGYWYVQANSIRGSGTHGGDVSLDPGALDGVLSEME